MIKRFIIAIILLVIIGGGLVGFNLFRAQAIKDYFANMKQPSQAVSTIDVKPGKWLPGIEALGSARAEDGVNLTFQVDGIVKEIMFKPNQIVKKGDLLLQLDDEIQKADLVASKAEAELSEQNYKRAQTLRTQGVGAVSNVDTTAAALSSAKANVAKAQATLDLKRLIAPFSGVIGISRVDIGQFMAPGTVVATLQNVDTMRVDFSVPEQELKNLSMGQEVHIGASASDYAFKGKIVGIDPKIDPASRLVSVQAQVDNSDKSLVPGQFVQVRVILPEEDNVVILPLTTVVTSLYGDYVFTVVKKEADKNAAADTAEKADDLVLHQIFVKLGRRTGNNVEILSGVKDGDVVVTSGQNRLSNGMSAHINNDVNPADAQIKK
ncbi:efflux RND transporter periplasmic adaptor subunit [Pseudochrobactrum asaccharolyticum]|uniref:Membrane fusion protein (Multidrug efflux system) n=1 Tax=Pseudochrobactrum asaccharolyticum TaxID=354351 RepID=A0A366DRJ4_9HYPH|nr:efflux RND transporter periplasmic adaptor subunit [Pseudochrobactrum asaccharolyticum]MDR2311693.1 efflux RND transporter periplasmic adaptor subunit [Brucellaceae bacterium]RBO91894.1 membrane fusion protein (multidrug efflux system) [Pseudochrobactrum asaccharolyticum]